MIYSENRVPLFGIMLSSSLPLPYGRSPCQADGPSHPAGHHVRYTGMVGRRTCMFRAGIRLSAPKAANPSPKRAARAMPPESKPLTCLGTPLSSD